MKAFQFKVDDKGGIADLEVVKAMSYKKAVKSFQAKHPELKYVDVGRIIKDGSYKVSWQKLPMGRKKKLGR